MSLNQIIAGFDTQFLDELIDWFSLHSSYPIDLTPVYDATNIGTHTLRLPDGLRAFSARKKSFKRVAAFFDYRLTTAERRHAAGHEFGHLFYHPGDRFHGCASGPGGLVRREELEADLVAAYLLVPGRAFYELSREGLNAHQIAVILDVPPALLDLRASLMIERNECGVNDSDR